MAPSATHRPRLCLLITQASWGGAQRYVSDLAIALRDQFDVVIAAGELAAGDELFRRAHSAGINTHRLRFLRRAIRPWDDIRAVFEIADLLRRGDFDILHTNSSKADVLGPLAARLVRPRPRTLATVHGWVFLEPLSPLRRWLYVLLERLAGRLRDHTIVLSTREQSAAIEHKIVRPNQRSVVPLGLPPVTFLPREAARAELARRTNLPTNATVVGTIANFYPAKGLDVLLRAAHDGKLDNAHVVIIGDGPERPASVPPRVHLLGAIPDAARLLPAFDIFVLPSRKEGLPYALLEAMTAGLPIVASAVGGIPEIITHEKNGLLVPAEDTAALAGAVSRLVHDEPLRYRLGAAAKGSAEKFSFAKQIADTLIVYQGLSAVKIRTR